MRPIIDGLTLCRKVKLVNQFVSCSYISMTEKQSDLGKLAIVIMYCHSLQAVLCTIQGRAITCRVLLRKEPQARIPSQKQAIKPSTEPHIFVILAYFSK